jgi:hypothetical protein
MLHQPTLRRIVSLSCCAVLLLACLFFARTAQAAPAAPAHLEEPHPLSEPVLRPVTHRQPFLDARPAGTHAQAAASAEVWIILDDDFEGTYRFEGDVLVLTDVKVTGLPSCGDKPGRCPVHLLANGNIIFTRVFEHCGPRGRSTAMEHEPVP